ncbi:hypothetical protein [Fonticella tunisiensis]|uniref:Uncharacterized protein n=1 Tax=Fonticella tunisiensis TaxID=1096341 RepID=A0A4R7KRS5_9CLOT|nr:hypothetical protein [Fonticella tunisiensis]TDT62295.1 hypothetical protein EDD71_10417 [Fonticella tunisiensis]
MNLDSYPENVRRYILELSKHGIIDIEGNIDRMFISYLYDQKFDENYVKSMINDRLKNI